MDNDGADLGMVVRLANRLGQRVDHVRGQRVALFRAIDGDQQDAVLDAAGDVLGGHVELIPCTVWRGLWATGVRDAGGPS